MTCYRCGTEGVRSLGDNDFECSNCGSLDSDAVQVSELLAEHGHEVFVEIKDGAELKFQTLVERVENALSE